MPQPTTVRDFIDHGDTCSESGPPSSIGQYDDKDSFIDDGSYHSSRDQLVAISERSKSPLFVRSHSGQSSARQSTESSSVLSAISRVARQHGLRVSSSTPASSRSNRSYSELRSESDEGSDVGRRVRRRLHDRSGSGDGSSLGGTESSPPRGARNNRAPSTTPDPVLIPDHIRKDEIKGLGVPGIRQGSGRARWAARYFLLTYSQSGHAWPFGELIELCATLDAKYHIARERHEDGGYHFHAFLDFSRKFETENVHRFCVGRARPGSTRTCPGQTHCNILPVPRTPFNAWDYVSKYGDVVASNLDRPPARGPNTTRDDLWAGSLALATKAEFLADISKHSPRDFCLYPGSIKLSAENKYGPDRSEPDKPDLETRGLTIHWDRYPSVREWILGSLPNAIQKIISTSRGSAYPQEVMQADQTEVAEKPHDHPRMHRPKSLILYGASRLGKSDFATSLGPHVQFRGTFNLESLLEVGIENVEYVIWDDIGWHDPALKHDKYKSWLGSQDNFNVTDRYKHKIRMKPWNKPSIFLANKNPFLDLHPEDSNWLAENCVVVDLGNFVEPGRANAICSETKNR